MVASGVRNSCEAVETNLDFISESSFSRCTAASASASARLPMRSDSISARLDERYSARSTAENTRIDIPAEVLNAPPWEKSRPIRGAKIGTIRQTNDLGLGASAGGKPMA